jgi:hypothetical protein
MRQMENLGKDLKEKRFHVYRRHWYALRLFFFLFPTLFPLQSRLVNPQWREQLITLIPPEYLHVKFPIA